MAMASRRGINSATRYVKRPLAFIPLVFSIIAFTLSLLCVLAGKRPGYYENLNLLTVNVSMIGHVNVSFNTSTGSIFKRELSFWDEAEEKLNEAKDILEYFAEQGNKAVDSIREQGTQILQNVTNEAVGFVAETLIQALNLHDFYSAHILTYCEGYYTPSALPNATHRSRKNVTRCSNAKGLFQFNPAQIVQSDLIPGIDLADLHWPEKIDDASKAVKTASDAMFVFYCLGIGMTGLALIGAMHGLFMSGNRSIVVNAICTLLAFLFLTIASGVTTAIIVTAVNAINQHGNSIGVAAYNGNSFLGVTWAATLFMLLGFTLWITMFVRGRRGKRGMKRGTEKSEDFGKA